MRKRTIACRDNVHESRVQSASGLCDSTPFASTLRTESLLDKLYQLRLPAFRYTRTFKWWIPVAGSFVRTPFRSEQGNGCTLDRMLGRMHLYMPQGTFYLLGHAYSLWRPAERSKRRVCEHTLYVFPEHRLISRGSKKSPVAVYLPHSVLSPH